MEANKDYAFCEASTAGSLSKWHIRPLNGHKPKLGGGADTPALCGRTVSWDLEIVLTEYHLKTNACPICEKIYGGRNAKKP